MSQDSTQRRMNISIPSEVEVGTPADFVSVWHTPNAFLMDFIVLKKPPQTETDQETGQRTARVDAVVSSRVRIPPEQVFPLIQALQAQGNMWLRETGRSSEPANWLDAHHEADTTSSDSAGKDSGDPAETDLDDLADKDLNDPEKDLDETDKGLDDPNDPSES